jgi:hypothetical protein
MAGFKHRNLLLIVVAIAVTTGVIVGVVVGIKKNNSTKNNATKDSSDAAAKVQNTMSCDSSKATVMEGFSIMPMASMNITKDMLTMDTLEMKCTGDETVFQKIKSESRTMENGDTETVWLGAMMEKGGQMAFATMVQSPDGLAGSFTTDSATFSLMQAPDGTMQMKTTLWSDLAEEGDSTDESFLPAVVNATKMILEAVNIPTTLVGKVKSEIVDEVRSVLTTGSTNRFLRESSHRELQTTSTIRVLFIVTHRAQCENAGLSDGCTTTGDTRDAFTRRVPILVSQTNQAMQEVDVSAQIEAAATIFLQSGFDVNADGDALDKILTSPDVAGWRNEYSADLVAMITGGGGPSCGIGRINGYVSATSHTCLDGFTFTHELYVFPDGWLFVWPDRSNALWFNLTFLSLFLLLAADTTWADYTIVRTVTTNMNMRTDTDTLPVAAAVTFAR